jgi:hypothetical protein
MEINNDKLDDTVLALLCLTSFEGYGAIRAWKGQDWDVLGRLYDKGMIANPRGKAKSVVFTDEGWERSRRLFKELFAV